MAFPSGSSSVVSNYQVQFAQVLMGPGTNYDVKEIQGLDLPPLRTKDEPRPLDVGQLMGQDFLDGRDITVELDVKVANLSGLMALVPQTVAEEFNLWVQVPTIAFPVGVGARIRKRNTPVDVRYTFGGLASVTYQFHATDPRLYEAVTTTSLTWGAGVSITNNGTMEERPQLTLVGPLTTPSVTNNTLPGAPFLSFQTLTAGQTLVVDLLTHLITLNGTAQPSAKLSTGNSWWWLQPGANTISWTSSDGAQPVGSSASITYSPAAYSSAT